jgi:hypothetical protein
MTPFLFPPFEEEQLDRLWSGLLDLLFELGDAFPPLMIGGGFGLVLKREYLKRSGERTVIERPELWPKVRSTKDLDVILPLEMLVDLERRRPFADALIRLRYQPIEESKYWQFAQPGDPGEGKPGIKVDLLGGPLLGSLARFQSQFQKDVRRWRPKSKGQPSVHIHARRTPEAVGVEEEPLSIPIEGRRSTGEPYQARVCIPQAFPYALMKLFAFRDQKYNPDPKKDSGRHHALDLYAIVAMMTEPEYDFAKRLREKYADNEKVREAAEIIRQDFAGLESIGVLRMGEHTLYNPAMDLNTFLSVLQEIFGP